MKPIGSIQGFRAVGKKGIYPSMPLTEIIIDIEALAKNLLDDENSIQAIIYVNEETPYIDATVLSSWLRKAFILKGKKVKKLSVDLDNTQNEYSMELYAKKE